MAIDFYLTAAWSVFGPVMLRERNKSRTKGLYHNNKPSKMPSGSLTS